MAASCYNAAIMGERFGNYELIEKIAVGGMAEIFLARASHGRGVARNIVIKRIHPALSADESFVGMFIDEARLGVTMMHGNIVPVFDFGCVDGYYYLAMEHVAGRDLSALLGRARVVGVPWPVEVAVYIVMEVLEGLDYAHRKRDDQGRPIELVHRDVSPSNILVSHDGQVKLLDFGIARSLASEYETRTGVVKGKPGYMSPEQAAGAAVDARADIWSCGAVLHELLTGAKVKDGRLQTTDFRIDEVLGRTLSADPKQRYASARDLQEALATILVERSQRPTARDLVTVVERICSATAPSEDWNMRTSGADLEKHLASALVGKPERVLGAGSTGSSARPAAPSAPPGETLDPTLRLSRPRRSPAWWLVATATVVIVSVTVWWSGLWRSAEPVPEVPPVAQFSVEAPTAMAKLSVSTEPSGALVRLDGKALGTAPMEVEVAPGAVGITAELEGYATFVQQEKLEPGGRSRLTAHLVPLPASLEIFASPKDATIEVDGAIRGRGHAQLSELAAGQHTITTTAPGFILAERNLELRGGQRETVRIDLKPKMGKPVTATAKVAVGNLSINTQPWSHVSIDGKPVGTTPIMDLEVRAGSHRLLLTNPVRNLSRTVDIEVAPGENKRIREVLDSEAP